MPLTKFDVCSNALMGIGANTITDFAGASSESAAAAQFFQTTADNWMSLYDWRFCTDSVQLSRLVDPPLHKWDAVYQQPSLMVRLIGVYVNDLPIPYDRREDKIMCNAVTTDEVYADFTYSVGVEYWPPYFVELVEIALMKKFAFSLGAKLDLKSSIAPDLDLQFRLAKNADARQQTVKSINLQGRGSIIEARRR